MKMNKTQVTVVIVSMNKEMFVIDCISSILKYTKVKFDIILVAYLFDKNSLNTIREKFPLIEIIESNSIRGFAENNNLALRNVNTPYTFVLNDDTLFKMDVLSELIDCIESPINATLVSPILYNLDGSVQFAGRRKYTFTSFVLSQLGFRNVTKSKYENGQGIFKTYNITGAAFLIKTKIFKEIGFFDEKYFFCPEDIALSTKLNQNGYNCFMNSNVGIIHYEGGSSKKSKLLYATTIAAYLGSSYFCGSNLIKRIILLILWKFKSNSHFLMKVLFNKEHNKDYYYIFCKVFTYYLKKTTTKNAFIEEYNKILQTSNN